MPDKRSKFHDFALKSILFKGREDWYFCYLKTEAHSPCHVGFRAACTGASAGACRRDCDTRVCAPRRHCTLGGRRGRGPGGTWPTYSRSFPRCVWPLPKALYTRIRAEYLRRVRGGGRAAHAGQSSVAFCGTRGLSGTPGFGSCPSYIGHRMSHSVLERPLDKGHV
jgi:hypothetical protein